MVARSGLEGRRHEAEQARTAGRGRRRRDGCEAHEGCIQTHADRAVSGEGMPRLTPDGRAVAGGAPPQRTKKAQTLTECAGRGMPPPLAEPASRGGLHGDGRDPERNLAIAERGADAARWPSATAGEVAAAFPAPRHTNTHHYHTHTHPTPRSDRLLICCHSVAATGSALVIL